MPPKASNARDRAALVSEGVETAAKRDKAAGARRVHMNRSRGPLLLVLFLGLAASWTWSARQMTGPVAVGSPEQRLQSAKAAIYLSATGIERFRAANGRLPVDLEEAGDEDLGVHYSPSGNSYTLVMEHGEVALRYRSGEDLNPYRIAFLVSP